MSGRLPSKVWLLTLICAALLFARLGGAHLHLCFDGKEPASSFHLFDNGLHHEPTGVAASHQDADIAVTGEALSKVKFELDLPLALLAAVFLLSLFRRSPHFVSTALPHAIVAAPRFLLPPVRGPPLLTSL